MLRGKNNMSDLMVESGENYLCRKKLGTYWKEGMKSHSPITKYVGA